MFYRNNFLKSVSRLKKSVYIIVRGRKINIGDQDKRRWDTLGTGFLAAPNRLVTAAHVINNFNSPENKLSHHQKGDKYYLLRHDDSGNNHFAMRTLYMNEQIFTYPELDLAIIYLDEEFYKKDNKVFSKKNDYIKISTDFLPIGSEIGILGYPLCELKFANKDINQPLVGNILLRTDLGVINCRYLDKEKRHTYEFTLSFNPGNSGGPIFDVKTGKLISIVARHRSIPRSVKEKILSEEKRKEFKFYKERSCVEVVHMSYSIGFATPLFLEAFKKHGIIN